MEPCNRPVYFKKGDRGRSPIIGGTDKVFELHDLNISEALYSELTAIPKESRTIREHIMILAYEKMLKCQNDLQSTRQERDVSSGIRTRLISLLREVRSKFCCSTYGFRRRTVKSLYIRRCRRGSQRRLWQRVWSAFAYSGRATRDGTSQIARRSNEHDVEFLAKYMTETTFQDVHAQWKATTTSLPKPEKQYSEKELEEEVEARLAQIFDAHKKGKKHGKKRRKSTDFLGYLGRQSTFDKAKKLKKRVREALSRANDEVQKLRREMQRSAASDAIEKQTKDKEIEGLISRNERLETEIQNISLELQVSSAKEASKAIQNIFKEKAHCEKALNEKQHCIEVLELDKAYSSGLYRALEEQLHKLETEKAGQQDRIRELEEAQKCFYDRVLSNEDTAQASREQLLHAVTLPGGMVATGTCKLLHGGPLTGIQAFKEEISALQKELDGARAGGELEEEEFQPSVGEELKVIKAQVQTRRGEATRSYDFLTGRSDYQNPKEGGEAENWIWVTKKGKGKEVSTPTPTIINITREEEQRRRTTALHVRITVLKDRDQVRKK
ncbi:hypothetical protein L7F22_053814 [Adiantum nelumboides]|nr:hypothetical protein [Adiantum nelumboides]